MRWYVTLLIASLTLCTERLAAAQTLGDANSRSDPHMRERSNPTRRSISFLITPLSMTMTLQSSFGGQKLIEVLNSEEARQESSSARSQVVESLRMLNRSEDVSSAELTSRGIREVIRDKYKKRYEEWKKEFLSTETGRSQWEMYAHKTKFRLTITVSDDNPHDARTDQYEWDSSGTLIAATITLGCRLGEGYPARGYYPVIGSLGDEWYSHAKKILAATKIAHEFGHVISTGSDREFERQTPLMLAYNGILLGNPHNRWDARLTDLEQQLGGTPVQIWADRECRAEANALLYLRDKINEGLVPRSLLNRIVRNLELNANSCAKCFGSQLSAQLAVLKK